MKPTLVVLAAGMGSRYGGLKQLDAVGPGGATLMDYSIYDALRAGFSRIVFVIRREMEDAFRDRIGRRYAGQASIAYAFQAIDDLPPEVTPSETREKPWGTGHALLCAAPQVREPMAVINADDFYGASAFRALGEFLRDARPAQPPTYAMVGYTLRDTVSEHGAVARGICRVDADGFLGDIVETTGIESADGSIFTRDDQGNRVPLTGDETVSMNLWGFTPDVFDPLRTAFVAFLERHVDSPTAEFYIPSAINDFVRAGRARVRVLPGGTRWCGVTYRQDRPAVERVLRELVEQGDYPANLFPS